MTAFARFARRIGSGAWPRLLGLGSLMYVAAWPAAAQTPEQVQYLPRDGAALILWMAPQGNVTGYNIYQTTVTDPSTKPAEPVKVNAELVKTTSFVVPNLTNSRSSTMTRIIISS